MAKKVINLEAATVAFDFSKDKLANGEAGPVIVLAAKDVPGFGTVTGTALHALLHGLSQKIGDSYANAKNQPNPVDWAVKQVSDLIESIRKAVWNAGRSGEGVSRVSILARALHRIKVAAGEPSTEAEAQAFVDSLSLDAEGKETKESIAAGKAKIAEYKSKKKVAKVIAQLQLEDAQAKLARAQAKAAAGETDEEEDDEDGEE